MLHLPHNCMKRILSIILIFVALTNIVGFMPLYMAALQEIKSEVKLQLSTQAELQQIQVSDAEYTNPAVFHKTGDDEFSYQGRMYDYKCLKKTNGGYIFYALEDTKEVSLIDLVKAAYAPSNATGKSKAPMGNLLKNFSKDFVGAISGQVVFPSASKPQIPFVATLHTCNGYGVLVQNPPDKDADNI